MAGHIRGLDHALVAVDDIDRAAEAYARLGFAITPRGRHVGWGTANVCVMFPDDYIELIGVVDPADFTGGLPEKLQDGEGLFGLAFASPDPEATAEAWRTAGLAPDGPMALGRVLDDGTETHLRFRNVLLPTEETFGLRLFACHAEDPAAVRRPEWLGHANGASGIAAATLVCPDPAALADGFERLLGAHAITTTDDTMAVHTGHGTVIVVTPDDLELLYPHMTLAGEVDRPRLIGLALVADDPEATASYLTEQGIPLTRGVGGTVNVAGDQACGVNLEFVALSATRLRPAGR
ncbi:VOC family protein [Marinivivus vitaminiproducens]|uniref:VOC family protein n=1 Tax=Marinivivus vitaminiproducens TaxID=3035935 RepID=UPI0027985DBD|nr:VOC family protein [Geminicoccaceae bacterium SCSIO 64248]